MSTCILWDFDGTLAFRDGMWTQSLSNVLNENGYKDFDRDLISSTMNPLYPWARYNEAHNDYFGGLSWWEYIEKCVVGKALFAVGITDNNENNRLANCFRDEYLRKSSWHLFEDTKRNVEHSLDLGYDNIILSNHTPELRMLAEHLGIDQYFKHIVTSALVGYEKPNPKFFDVIKTFEHYDRYIMIGDNYWADILGSINYGLAAIMVRKENVYNYNYYSKDIDGIWDFIER